MNKLTKIIFEELGVEPDELFEITSESKCFEYEQYLIDKDLNIYGVNTCLGAIEFFPFINKVDFPDITTFINDPSLIKKKPKPLLTDEEREWLSGFEGLVKVEVEWDILRIYFEDSYLPINIYTLKYKFKGLVERVEYTREELGL